MNSKMIKKVHRLEQISLIGEVFSAIFRKGTCALEDLPPKNKPSQPRIQEATGRSIAYNRVKVMKLSTTLPFLLIQSAAGFSYLNSLSPNGAAATTAGTSYAPSSSSSATGSTSGGSSIHPHVASPSAGANAIGPSEEMLTLISRQVSVELMASQAYMAASIWFRARNMDGMAAWMLEESDEERGHGKEILVSAAAKYVLVYFTRHIL